MDEIPLSIAWVEVVGALVALVLSAVFSGSEIAFYASQRLYLLVKVRRSRWIGRFLRSHLEQPSRFVMFILISNNLVLVIFSLLFAQVVQSWVEGQGIAWTSVLDFWLTTGLSTATVLLFGEYFPKALFYRMPERMLLRVMPVLMMWYVLIYPLYAMILGVVELIGKVMGVGQREPSVFSLKDWYLLVAGGQQQESASITMMRRAMAFPDVRLRHCLVPRSEVVAIDVNASEAVLRRLFQQHGVSRIIVYDNDPTRIIGYVHAVSLFRRPRDIREVLMEVPVFPESMKAEQTLRKMIADRKNLAVVVDEYGVPVGVVTLEDILEEIVGDIRDEFDRGKLHERKIGDGEYEFSARLEIDYLNDKYGMGLPKGDYQTLGGLVVHEMGHIPRRGERVIIFPYEFEVLRGTPRRVELLRVRKIASVDDEANDSESD